MENDTPSQPAVGRSILWLVVIIIIAALGFAWSKQRPSETIKIGVIFPLSGSTSSTYGENGQRGLLLALEDANASALLTDQISLTIEDSQGQPRLGVNAINKLIAQGHRFIISDQISGVTLAIAPIAGGNKVVLIAPGSASPKVTEAGDYIFRTKVSAAVESKVVADFLKEQMGVRSVAFLYQNSDYGKGVFLPMRSDAINRGVAVVAEEHFDIGATDIRTQLAKIKSSSAELVIVAGYPKEIGQILKQSAELRVGKKFFAHSGSVGPDIVKIAGTAADNLLFLYELDLNLSQGRTADFFKRYMERYGESPELFSLLAYDTLVLLSEKVRLCKRVVSCVKDELYKTKNYSGITGPISFDMNGDIVRNKFTLFTIKNGQFVVLEE